jgi:hypothetical protein
MDGALVDFQLPPGAAIGLTVTTAMVDLLRRHFAPIRWRGAPVPPMIAASVDAIAAAGLVLQ